MYFIPFRKGCQEQTYKGQYYIQILGIVINKAGELSLLQATNKLIYVEKYFNLYPFGADVATKFVPNCIIFKIIMINQQHLQCKTAENWYK